MSAIPPTKSSSSRSSKTPTRSGGMSSLNPAMKALNCSSTRFWIFHSVTNLFSSALDLRRIVTESMVLTRHIVSYSHWSLEYLFHPESDQSSYALQTAHHQLQMSTQTLHQYHSPCSTISKCRQPKFCIASTTHKVHVRFRWKSSSTPSMS